MYRNRIHSAHADLEIKLDGTMSKETIFCEEEAVLFFKTIDAIISKNTLVSFGTTAFSCIRLGFNSDKKSREEFQHDLIIESANWQLTKDSREIISDRSPYPSIDEMGDIVVEECLMVSEVLISTKNLTIKLSKGYQLKATADFVDPASVFWFYTYKEKFLLCAVPDEKLNLTLY